MPRNPVFRIQVTIVKQKGRAQRRSVWIPPAALLPACPMLGWCWQKAWGQEAARSTSLLPLAWCAPCKGCCWLWDLGRAAGGVQKAAQRRGLHFLGSQSSACLADKLGIKSSKAGSMCLFLWLSLGGSFMSSCCWWPRLREAFGTVPSDFICSPRNGCFPAFFPSSTILLSREGAFRVEEQLARLD